MANAGDPLTNSWGSGSAPVAVVMISLNEGHNMEAILQNLKGWAQEVFLVDSYSVDNTVDIALRHGVHVVQRKFRGFGDQWNFALNELPITAPWTMKIDPDERLTDELKFSITRKISEDHATGISFDRRLWFMGKPLPVKQELTRIWRTGQCRFTDVSVNEYPVVAGRVVRISGDMEHHDSPDLDHWLEKQNRYTTAEAIMAYQQSELSETPRLLGSPFQRRMWMKRNFHKLPFRFFLFFLYQWLVTGAWRIGRVGYIWARLRSDVMRLIDCKRREIEMSGKIPSSRHYGHGKPDSRVKQYE